jgi:hypothetical protein
MYPTGELNVLLARKATLRRRIAVRRWQCVEDAQEIARPLAVIDRIYATWKKIRPWVKIAGVPAALLLARSLGGRFRMLRSLGRWAPLLVSIFRGVSKRPRSPARTMSRRAA